MEVGAEIAFRALAHHGRDDFVINHQTPQVSAAGFLDELLYQDVHFGAAERFDD